MQKFTDYVKLKEVSAMSLGKDILGGASGLSLDAKTEGALQAVLESFELLLDARPNMVISWLKRTSSSIPEVSDQINRILAQHDFDSLPDLKGAVRRAGKKLGSAIKKGLGDEESKNNDILSPSAADSFKGEAYFIETAAVCSRCGKEGRASRFDINAGKAKCRDCGGFMNMAEPKPRKKKDKTPEPVQQEGALKPNYYSYTPYTTCMKCGKLFKKTTFNNKVICPECIEKKKSPEKKEEEKRKKLAMSKQRNKLKIS